MKRISAVLFFLMGYWAAVGADKDLLVEYEFKGRKVSLQGKQEKDHTYVFNIGGKRKIALGTLEWAPYIGENICKQGWVQQFTIALLASLDFEITTTFYAWEIAVTLAEKGELNMIYPNYYIDLNAPSTIDKRKTERDLLAISERFPGGPIALIKRKGEPIRFSHDLEALKGEKIGVVRGYQNTPEFDALLNTGIFSVDKSIDDEQNAKKLESKRVNLIVGDPAVIRYTLNLSVDPSVKNLTDLLEVVQPVLRYNHLYFALSKALLDWPELLDLINLRISEFEADGTLINIIKNTNKTCGYTMETLLPYKG